MPPAVCKKERGGYLDLARDEPERFRVIDSSGAPDVTSFAVDAALADFFGPLEGE